MISKNRNHFFYQGFLHSVIDGVIVNRDHNARVVISEDGLLARARKSKNPQGAIFREIEDLKNIRYALIEIHSAREGIRSEAYKVEDLVDLNRLKERSHSKAVILDTEGYERDE